jgi:hypothetical protein
VFAPVTVPVASAAFVPPAPSKAANKGKKGSNWTEPEEEWLRSTIKTKYGEPVPKNSWVNWKYIALLWANDWPKTRKTQSLAVKYSHMIGNYRDPSKMRNKATRDEDEAGGEDLRKGVERAQEKEVEDAGASKKRCRAVEGDDDAPTAKKLRKVPTTSEHEEVTEEVTEPEASIDWHTPVTFDGDNDLHRNMGKMSPTQADYVCLVVLRQFIFRGIPEVDWIQVRDGYNAKFSPQPGATLVDIFWNYCQWFKDLSGFGPGVERSISVGEWGRVLGIDAEISGGRELAAVNGAPCRAITRDDDSRCDDHIGGVSEIVAAGEQVEPDEDIEMSDSGSVYPGKDAYEGIVEENNSYLGGFEVSKVSALEAANHDGDHDGNQTEMISNIQTPHNMDSPSDSLSSLFNEAENKDEAANDNECSRSGDEPETLAMIHTVGRITNDSILGQSSGVPVVNEDIINKPFLGDESGSGEHPVSHDDSLIMDENRQIVLDNAAAMNPNSVVFEEDSDLVADDTTLLELTDAPPPEHPREDDQMLVDEFAIVNDGDSKSWSPEPFVRDESASHEPGENNVSVIDDSSVFDEYARNRQIALDNAAAMNPNSVVFEEDPNPVADDTIPVEPADAPPSEHPKKDDQKPVDQPVTAKSKYSRSRAIWRQVRLSRTP